MVKTVKFGLIYKDTPELDYKGFCGAMWDIQRDIRQYKNHVASHYFDYLMKRFRVKEETGEYPKDEELFGGCKLRNFMYRKAAEMIPAIQTGNASTISEATYDRLKSDTKEMLSGTKSLPSFKRDQPINISKQSIKLDEADGKVYMTVSVFSNAGKKERGLKSGQLTFEVWHKSKSGVDIVKRCISSEYGHGSAMLIYNKDAHMWECNLTYKPPEKTNSLNPGRICGIDIGVIFPIYAAINDSHERMYIPGGDIEQFSKRINARREGLSKSRQFAGDGSVGHGYKARMKPVLDIGDKIARFRDTKNHVMSKKLIEFAVKNRCGTIQFRDYTGISNGKLFLRNWSYYDLQQKIAYKAKAAGINVVIVEPQYTSQRCHKCGYIDEENIAAGRMFACISCGYKGHVDYNAAKNTAIAGIDKIIEAQKCEPQASMDSSQGSH